MRATEATAVTLPDLEAVRREVASQRDEIVDLLRQTVAVASVTGQEDAVAPLYEAWLRDLPGAIEVVPVQVDELADPSPWERERELPTRANLFATLWEGRARPVLAINGHMDVVPAAEDHRWTRTPFSGALADGRVWGRGASDTKGSLAAALGAVRVLARLGIDPGCQVEVQCVVGEETGGLGTLHALATRRHADAAIVLEPTEGRPVIASSGGLNLRVDVVGRAGHAGTPWRNVSALEKLLAIDAEIAQLARRRAERALPRVFADLPDPAPYHVTGVHAGEWHTMTPAEAHLIARFGVLPGETIAEARAQLIAEVSDACARDAWLSEHPARVSWLSPGYPAWATPEADAVVDALRYATRVARGSEALGAATFGSDAGHLATAGVSTVLFGPGDLQQAHMVDESIAEEAVLGSTVVLALAIAAFGAA